MKALRSPWVVGVLVLLAVALVGRNVFWPVLKNIRWRRSAAPPAVQGQRPPEAPRAEYTAKLKTTTAAAVQPIKDILDQVMAKTRNEPPPAMEVRAVRANASHWLQSPRRDPFNNRAGRKSRAEQLLSLKSVWRQSGSEFAVINDRVLAQGDSILEWTLEKIESGHVWVTGPEGREPLTFKIPRPVLQVALERESPGDPVKDSPEPPPSTLP